MSIQTDLKTPLPQSRKRLQRGRRTWVLMLLDAMAVAWMVSAGTWFDERGLLGVITLGGHPNLVTLLAVASFLVLAGLAVSTEGFTWASPAELALLALAGVLTTVALAGLLSLGLLVLIGGTFIGLLIKLALR
jgi:hypothetical protein